MIFTVPWLRRLFAGFSPRRPGIASRSVHVGFVLDEVALRQVFLRVLRFSPVIIIPPLLHIHSCIIWGMDRGPVNGPVSHTSSHPIAVYAVHCKKENECLYRVSHVTRNPLTGMRWLCSPLWLTHFPPVRSLFLRHAVVGGSTLSGTPCIYWYNSQSDEVLQAISTHFRAVRFGYTISTTTSIVFGTSIPHLLRVFAAWIRLTVDSVRGVFFFPKTAHKELYERAPLENLPR
jgi:hypothetical protein